jgi:hypothetical protein
VKRCARCGEEKSLDDFYRRATGSERRQAFCKKCDGEASRATKLAGYGLTVDDYEILISEQDGGCAICGDNSHTLHVDHDHKTGKVRGLLCRLCNTALGKFIDDRQLLEAAILYLDRAADMREEDTE